MVLRIDDGDCYATVINGAVMAMSVGYEQRAYTGLHVFVIDRIPVTP